MDRKTSFIKWNFQSLSIFSQQQQREKAALCFKIFDDKTDHSSQNSFEKDAATAIVRKTL
mgnify:CR=1 FL=1